MILFLHLRQFLKYQTRQKENHFNVTLLNFRQKRASPKSRKTKTPRISFTIFCRLGRYPDFPPCQRPWMWGRRGYGFSNSCVAGLNFAGAGQEQTKNFNPCRTLVHARGGRSHFFELWLRSCSKMFESGSVTQILKLWESDSCSESGYHWGNRKLPMVLLQKWPRILLLLPRLKSHSGSTYGFSKNFDSDPGPKEKWRILLEWTSSLRIRGYLWSMHTSAAYPQIKIFMWCSSWVLSLCHPEQIHKFAILSYCLACTQFSLCRLL